MNARSAPNGDIGSGQWRVKSAKRIAEEMAYCHNEFGSDFVWLTDDNFGTGTRPAEIAEEIMARKVPERCFMVCAGKMR